MLLSPASQQLATGSNEGGGHVPAIIQITCFRASNQDCDGILLKSQNSSTEKDIASRMTQQLPLSPPSEPASSPEPPIVPLDSPLRTAPIHDLLPDIRVPSSPLPTHRYNPITCAPIEPAVSETAVRSDLEALRKEYPTPDAASKAQEQAARELKQNLEDADKKREEVQRAMDKKVKERNTELKVLEKYQDGKSGLLTS